MTIIMPQLMMGACSKKYIMRSFLMQISGNTLTQTWMIQKLSLPSSCVKTIYNILHVHCHKPKLLLKWDPCHNHCEA